MNDQMLAVRDYSAPLYISDGFEYTDDGVPVFIGKTLEDHSGMWTTLHDADNRVQWHKAAIAASLHEKYGSGAIDQFCGTHGVKSSYFYQLIRTYRRFVVGECTQVHSLPFAHHTAVSYIRDSEQAQQWLEKAEERNWTKQTLQVEIRKAKARERLATSDNPILEEERLFWESSVRPALYRYIQEYPERRRLVVGWIDEGDGQFKMRVMTKQEMAIQKIEEGCRTVDSIAEEMGWTKDVTQVILDDLEGEGRVAWYKPEKTTYMARGGTAKHYRVVYPPDSEGSDLDFSDEEEGDL